MAITNNQKADLSFKKIAANVANSSTDKSFFEESVSSRRSILLSDIWTDSNQIPNTAAQISNVVTKLTDLVLSNIPGTTSFEHPNLKDIIPYNFGDGISYVYSLKTSNNKIIPFGFKDWYLDTEGGVLTFFGGFSNSGSIIINSNNPPSITCFKYIGTKGIFSTGNNQQANTIVELLSVNVNGDTVFNISQTPTKVLDFIVNGQSQVLNVDFTVSGNSLQWISSDFDLETTDEIKIKYEF